jgi:hypothetical protein
MSPSLRTVAITAAALVLVGSLLASRSAPSKPTEATSTTLLGREVAVGSGTARMFVTVGPHGEPRTVGVALSEAALTGLAPRMNTTSRCFDKNRDGRHAHGECLGDYQSTLALPDGTEDLGLPVRWATVNWNPEGHLPPAPPVWSAAHFDFHFFMAEPELIYGIRPGPCAEFISCEDSARASKPLAAEHHPEGYIDVGAAVAAMGNHLVDSHDPELADPSLGFSRTFIYGAYDGRLIFLEPMVSHAFLRSRPDKCTPIRAPKAYASPGYYPTSYCVRHDAATATYRVSLEGLVYRD